jgi:hypothetical protein
MAWRMGAAMKHQEKGIFFFGISWDVWRKNMIFGCVWNFGYALESPNLWHWFTVVGKLMIFTLISQTLR